MVPGEIGNAPRAALEAQAIAARSYAVARAGRHEDEGADLCDGTHCQVYLGRLAATCRALIDAGRDRDEPAALVMWATTPEERTVLGSLTDLPALAAAASFGPPATLIVGDVAAIPREVAAITADLRQTANR